MRVIKIYLLSNGEAFDSKQKADDNNHAVYDSTLEYSFFPPVEEAWALDDGSGHYFLLSPFEGTVQ